ncbi:MAG: PAS-domain containing protein [Sneathiella sp.]
MSYLNSELLEVMVITSFPIAFIYHLWSLIPRERGLTSLALGLIVVSLGVFLNYLTHTPLQGYLAAVVGAENLIYIRTAFYIPGGILAFIGISAWFPRIIDFQSQIKLRKQAEHLVTEKNDLISLVMESSRQGILLLDKNLNVQLTNKRYLELLDLPKELGEPGTSYKDIIYFIAMRGEYGKGDVQTIYEQWSDIIFSQKYLHFQRARPNGTILDIEARWIPGSGFLSTFTDVTQQAHAEMELKRSEEKFRDFTESASDWMWEMDKDYNLSYVSDRGLQMSGRSSQELLGSQFSDFILPTSKNWKRQNTDSFLKSRHSFIDILHTMRRPKGDDKFLSISGKPIFNSSGEFQGYRGVGRDITIRQQMEDQLRQSLKMEAIGRLTGGIAHDFNNLLAIILGNVEFLQEQAEESGYEGCQQLKTIDKAALRGAELTQQLLSFSRKQTLRPSSLDLLEGLKGIITIIDRSLGEDIQIKVAYGDHLWRALGDLGQLENAILNLANNARDAMPNGGALTIKISNHIELYSNAKTVDGLPAGEYVMLSVSDTGTGMDEATSLKAFEPFFTTKDVGKGTGLGLSMVFGFAKQSGGHVCVKSHPNTGTAVSLYLPRAKEKQPLDA